jgi:hypothetical protein
MKKLLFMLTAAMGLFVASCKQGDVTPSSSDDILDAVSASAARTAAVSDTATKKVCKGNITSVDPAALPSAITTYISTNYAGASIKFAGKDAVGQYLVGIEKDTVRTGLLFDANGVFIKAMVHYAKQSKLTEVAVTALPAAITTYISTNYAGYTIKRAGTDASGNYLVGILDSAGTTRVVLQFTSAGVFTAVKEVPPHQGKGGKGGTKR